MKFIKEWKQFLTEENFISDYNFNLDYDDEGNVVLYHVSPTPDIDQFNPDLNINYSRRKYESPRCRRKLQ